MPVPYANLTNPQTLNLYAMVADDPESFADLDGHGDGKAEPVCNASGTSCTTTEKRTETLGIGGDTAGGTPIEP